MSILESNCMQSTASAAGYSTGAMVCAAIPALLLLSATPENPRGEQLPWPLLAGWILLMALLGVAIAIPMKRSMINRERLKFPSGTAAATMLQSLYSHGAEALGKARALMYAALVAGTTPLLDGSEAAEAERRCCPARRPSSTSSPRAAPTRRRARACCRRTGPSCSTTSW